MHTEVEYVDLCLDILQNEWDGHIGVYAHSGTSIDGDWTFNNVISAEEYCAYSSKWKKRGINFIGGCCGVHTDHIDMMCRELFTNTR
jgi:S-methylmethionine-dependent homocysteine/selenocysteine methylase